MIRALSLTLICRCPASTGSPWTSALGGTAFFRYNAEMLLPQEPQELEDAWQRRVSRATLTPFTVRIAEQAAGLVLRKPIVLESKEQDGEIDRILD